VVPLILEHIASVNEYATVAVIAPTEREATKWHALLRAELATGRRLASLSRREDLTGRFEIHFTQVYETKGLEFDVVIVPDLGAFELENEIGRNQAYVAISRPRQALFLGCSSSKCQSKEISTLVTSKLVKLVNVI
jgi:DNA helicase IV